VYLDGEVGGSLSDRRRRRRATAGENPGAAASSAHHPIGSHARLGIARVIERHEGQMRPLGSRALAHDMMLAPSGRGPRAAHEQLRPGGRRGQQLEMPMMNIHLAADIIGGGFSSTS